MKTKFNKNIKYYFFIIAILFIGSIICLTSFAQFVLPNETTGFTFPEPIKDPPYKVGVCNYSVLNSWRVQMVEEIKEEAKRQSAYIEELYITNAEDNLAKQIADLEDLIAKGCDIIIIDPMADGLLSKALEAAELGIVVVDFDANLPSDKFAHILVDNEEFGRVGAQWLANTLEGKGKIIILNGVKGNQLDLMRYQGAMSVFENYPDIEILGEAFGHWDYAAGKRATEDFLAAHTQIDGVWSQGGAMTQGAIEAFVEAGRPLVPMSGEDNNGYLRLWKKYQDQGFRGYSASMPTYVGSTALGLALNIIQGRPYHLFTKIPIPSFGDDRLDEFYIPELPDSYWANTRISHETAKRIFER